MLICSWKDITCQSRLLSYSCETSPQTAPFWQVPLMLVEQPFPSPSSCQSRMDTTDWYAAATYIIGSQCCIWVVLLLKAWSRRLFKLPFSPHIRVKLGLPVLTKLRISLPYSATCMFTSNLANAVNIDIENYTNSRCNTHICDDAWMICWDGKPSCSILPASEFQSMYSLTATRSKTG